MSILKKYNKKLLARGYNGPLGFNLKFELGHIITFQKRSGFEVVGDISNPHFKLTDFTPQKKIGQSMIDIDLGTETGVNIEVKAKGDAPIPNSNLSVEDAGLVIEFENKASYLLKTGGTKVNFIQNIAELGDRVKALYKSKSWNRKWYIITQVVEAERATLLISKSRNSKISLKAKGSVSSIGEDDLVSADLGLNVVVKKQMSTSFIGKEGPYFPLFKANGIRVRKLFNSPPVGSEFEMFNTIDPMNEFTISALEDENSPFDLFFEEYHFEEEMMEDEDLV